MLLASELLSANTAMSEQAMCTEFAVLPGPWAKPYLGQGLIEGVWLPCLPNDFNGNSIIGVLRSSVMFG
jgi:hypothetical protein